MLKALLVYETNPLLGINQLVFLPSALLGGKPDKFAGEINKQLRRNDVDAQVDVDQSFGDYDVLSEYDVVLVTTHANQFLAKRNVLQCKIIEISTADFFEDDIEKTVSRLLEYVNG